MELRDFLKKMPSAGLGLSGGVDSTYLLYEAVRCGARVRAYFVKSAFQPQFELEDAERAARECGADLEIINVDVLAFPNVAENSAERCYHCKRAIFSAIAERAKEDGCEVLLDGTNASDEVSDRPGMRALSELKVLSPLRECGITKAEIRESARAAGLFTADKPAYACLATRVAEGEELTAELLSRIERAEGALFDLGYEDFRVRVQGGAAKLQVKRADLMRAVSEWDELRAAIKKEFKTVVLDLKGR